MKGLKGAVVTFSCLWLAGVLQANATLLMAFGAMPDFILTTAVVLSAWSGRRTAATIGFFAGLIHGSLFSSSIGYYIVSRTCACFGVSWSRRLDIELSFWLIGVTAFLATAFVQAFQLFLPPPQNILRLAVDTIMTATYNGVLAMPLYALLKKILDPVTI